MSYGSFVEELEEAASTGGTSSSDPDESAASKDVASAGNEQVSGLEEDLASDKDIAGASSGPVETDGAVEKVLAFVRDRERLLALIDRLQTEKSKLEQQNTKLTQQLDTSPGGGKRPSTISQLLPTAPEPAVARHAVNNKRDRSNLNEPFAVETNPQVIPRIDTPSTTPPRGPKRQRVNVAASGSGHLREEPGNLHDIAHGLNHQHQPWQQNSSRGPTPTPTPDFVDLSEPNINITNRLASDQSFAAPPAMMYLSSTYGGSQNRHIPTQVPHSINGRPREGNLRVPNQNSIHRSQPVTSGPPTVAAGFDVEQSWRERLNHEVDIARNSQGILYLADWAKHQLLTNKLIERLEHRTLAMHRRLMACEQQLAQERQESFERRNGNDV